MSLEGINQHVIFLHGDNYQGKVTSQTTTLGWIWPGVCLSNQIVGFFDHQHLWKEFMDILVVYKEIVIEGSI